MGDFNNVMTTGERVGKETPHHRETTSFVDALQAAGLIEMNTSAKEDLYRLQHELQQYPFNDNLILQEQQVLKIYSELAQAEQSDLQQKASVNWLILAYRCTSFYHNTIKERNHRNTFCSLVKADGLRTTNELEVKSLMEQYFFDMVGTEHPTPIREDIISDFIPLSTIPTDMHHSLDTTITKQEIFEALQAIGDTKLPGPDGYTAKFFKTTFIPGRSIQENLILSHGLIRSYNKRAGTPKCSIKIDIRKAYDILSWKALKLLICKFNFPSKLATWISMCGEFLTKENGEILYMNGDYKVKVYTRSSNFHDFLMMVGDVYEVEMFSLICIMNYSTPTIIAIEFDYASMLSFITPTTNVICVWVIGGQTKGKGKEVQRNLFPRGF
ncbi:hypothetical protein FRX31_030588 [Thalictrum thalictroides]|uniref:Reverse transcriptase domain-containing protein n=1 Tax=Thalictrum thalictroides TaxID=46969 RepID=A0A7J6V430_THATH|nr:hypothetical protein FRX31_030588 [Thalictrum thalictroides]